MEHVVVPMLTSQLYEIRRLLLALLGVRLPLSHLSYLANCHCPLFLKEVSQFYHINSAYLLVIPKWHPLKIPRRKYSIYSLLLFLFFFCYYFKILQMEYLLQNPRDYHSVRTFFKDNAILNILISVCPWLVK